MKTIFLIDDDADDREIFQAALDSLNFPHTYVEARDGHEALELISKSSFKFPDIIFLDLNMPKVGGHDVLIAVKKLPQYEKVPVIIYSTSSAEQEKEKCFAEGAEHFMTKHSSYEALCEELGKIIAQML